MLHIVIGIGGFIFARDCEVLDQTVTDFQERSKAFSDH